MSFAGSRRAGSSSARRIPTTDGRSLFALTASGDREWHNGWPALQRINRALELHLDDPDSVRTAVTDLGSAFAAALVDE